MNGIYLDYAAATPLDKRVAVVMAEHEGEFHNPSAIYLAGRKSADLIEESRQKAANIIGAKPAEIIFTGGATEADNLAVAGVLAAHPEGRVAVAATEHKAVLESALASGRADIIPVDSRGIVTPDALEKVIKPATVLVSVAYADSEIGAIQNFRQLAPVVRTARQARAAAGGLPIYLHTDASQAANYLDLHVSRLGVDLMSLGGGKIYGPKGSGLLYVSHRVAINPVIRGGGQERGLRSGTEHPAAIIGLVRALELAQLKRKTETSRLRELKGRLMAVLADLPRIEFNGDIDQQLPNIINFSVGNADGERLVMELDEKGLQVGTGAACSIRDDKPSHVLKAVGLSDARANGSLRLSLGRPTTAAQVRQAAEILKTTIAA